MSVTLVWPGLFNLDIKDFIKDQLINEVRIFSLTLSWIIENSKRMQYAVFIWHLLMAFSIMNLDITLQIHLSLDFEKRT